MARVKIKLEITGDTIDDLLGIVVNMKKDLHGESGDVIAKDNKVEYAILVQGINELIKALENLDRNKSHSLIDEQNELNMVNQLISSIIKAVFEPNNVSHERIPSFVELLKELIRFFDNLLREIVGQEIPFVKNVDALRTHLETNRLF